MNKTRTLSEKTHELLQHYPKIHTNNRKNPHVPWVETRASPRDPEGLQASQLFGS